MPKAEIFVIDNVPCPGGVARHFQHVLDGLITHFGARVTVFSQKTHNYGLARHIRSLPTNFKGSGRIRIQRINEFLADKLAEHQHASIFYSPYFGNIHTSAKQVFTIYDMIYELRLSRTRINQVFIDEKKRCIERAALLIAISHSTARDIAACYPHIDKEKIVTIWPGVDPFFFEAPPVPFRGQKPYFLYVGRRNEYKNFRNALQAYSQSGLVRSFDLRVISPLISLKFDEEEIALLTRLNLEKNVDLRLAVNEEELRESYAGAVALVYPSTYEGFGLPILEAMAAGTLVAAAKAASMPEAAGNNAVFFDPHSIDSIAEALQLIAALSDVERRTRIAQGIAHARQFNWGRCQQQTVKAIGHLLSPSLYF
jgi:glycosyltransferase involved in cell wall biosynthesis